MQRKRPLRSHARSRPGRTHPLSGPAFLRILPVLLVVSLPVVVTTGCSMGYLWHLGKGQARILLGMQPADVVLQDESTDPSVRDKILLLQEAKRFGEQVLGLAPSRSYTYFYQVENPPLGYNLTASPQLELDAYLWCFPIAGCVPYKGFFERERAERERDKMAALGYDVYFRPLIAYSTLGWFPDPIFSTWLGAGRAFLVETVLHEMVHGTVYVKDESTFNEGIATFICERGTVAFFRSRGTDPDAFFHGLNESWAAQNALRDEMRLLAERLRELYASDLDPKDKLQEKSRLSREAKQALRERLSPEQERRFARVFRTEWNNAFVVTQLTYHQDIDLWGAVLDRFAGDLPAMVDWAKGLHGVRDPSRQVRAWLEQPVAEGSGEGGPSDGIVH